MKISVIQNTNFVNSRNNTQKNNKNVNFKGYTYKPILESVWCHHGNEYYYNYPPRLIDTGFTMKNEIPDIRTRNNPIKVYVASPGEEIPEEIYKTHTHIQRNDMYLSQIRKDYLNGYMDFANNAHNEILHLEWKKDNVPDWDKENIQTKLSRAKRRYDVLLKMDELSGKRETLMHYKPDTESEVLLSKIKKKEIIIQKISQNNVNKAEVNKRENLLNELNEELKIKQDKFAKSEEKRLSNVASVEEEMKKEFSNIENIYKEYYPEWAD